MNIQDKMQAFMNYFHKNTHYWIVAYEYNPLGMIVNMEIWDEFHKAGIITSLAEKCLKQENYKEITKLIVERMQQEEVIVYGCIR
jgi:hypothetical protein